MQPIFGFLGRLSLPALLFFSLCGYFLLALAFPLVPHYAHQPVADIRTFHPSASAGLIYAALIAGLFGLHALLVRRLRRWANPNLLGLLLAAALFSAPLVVMYPINANDIYRYAIRGIISSQFDGSPYEFTPADLEDGTFAELAGEWRNATSPYGPLWEHVASRIAAAAGGDLLLSLILFKLLGFLSLAAAGAILWRIYDLRAVRTQAKDGRQAAFAALWLLNPGLLLSFVTNAHNDALMIAILLLGWLFIKLERYGPGLLVMFMAALVKPVALLGLPIAFLFTWKEMHDRQDRVLALLWLLGGGLVLTFLAFRSFGAPDQLVWRLLREASSGASFAPATTLILLALELGWHGSLELVASIVAFCFALFYSLLLWLTWRRSAPEESTGAAFYGYGFQALNFRIWYATWPFPWFLVNAMQGGERARYLAHSAWWFLFTSQLSVVIYGHMRVAFLGGSQLAAHLFSIPFVFLLPFILARISLRLGRFSALPPEAAERS